MNTCFSSECIKKYTELEWIIQHSIFKDIEKHPPSLHCTAFRLQPPTKDEHLSTIFEDHEHEGALELHTSVSASFCGQSENNSGTIPCCYAALIFISTDPF